ncbi:exodeoxyribonuclease V subunit alpha [Marilutibacter alkalisoli]|uniref:RecBCD enzyme subunit RecD n=1 Tax=Marilutibacter alkalisoli TaxID=2591633 RepID=A0A514BMZ9_9GAMM|nr:exodeoxyribonuclease V subunit alpha [Lysobacter alkalisoli]QDH68757.1 exodeoxyribonuclease V subunit alpha [Lysobacter alkalisoli]
MSAPSLLNALWQSGQLRTLDHALAQSLRRLDPDTPDEVLAAAALASLAVSQGHAGFDPAQPQMLVEAPLPWPEPEAWTRALGTSRWVATPEAADIEAATDAPLVLEHTLEGRGLLYLRRYREYERRLALQLHRIAAHPLPGDAPTPLAPLFAQLFPTSSLLPPAGDKPAGTAGLDDEVARRASAMDGASQRARRADEGAFHEDRQARAAAVALRHALLLVTGGPGTGKTTTITRLLTLLVAQARHAGRAAPRIALAAPTGRAAERMAESVRAAAQTLEAAGIDAGLCAQLPTTGTTLHRLLGTIPDTPRFRHHADHPLPLDVVVVDEASMIDLPLMTKLVEAVPDGARLVLLGDPDQLPSVEAGDVLAGILLAAGDGAHLTAADAEALQPLLGTASAAAVSNVPPAFPARHVHLTRGFRQHDALQLAPLAIAVRTGDATSTLDLLRGATLPGVHFHEDLADPLQVHRDRLLAHWTSLARTDSPAEALRLATRLRLLTAVRDGPQGARSVNARVEAILSGSRLGGSRGRGAGHFHGRLLLITQNSYRHRLFNGDIGICLRDDDGHLVAWFPGEDPSQPRPFHPATLPAHESAFAMTVHKAQGSEFDEVWLLLPERSTRVLSRELVYTGITRARRELHLAGSAGIIEAALARHASRWSGLGWRLGFTDY